MSVERPSTSTASTMVQADLMSAERFCSQRVASSAEYQLLFKMEMYFFEYVCKEFVCLDGVIIRERKFVLDT